MPDLFSEVWRSEAYMATISSTAWRGKWRTQSVLAGQNNSYILWRPPPLFLRVNAAEAPEITVGSTKAKKPHTGSEEEVSLQQSMELSDVIHTRVSGIAFQNKSSSAPPFDTICYDIDCAWEKIFSI